MVLLIFVILLVMLVSAFASGVEAAIFTVPYSRIRSMAKANKPGAKALLRVKEDMVKAIGTVVVMNNISNIAGSGVAGVIAHDLFGPVATGVFFFFFTLVIIIFSELIPKTLGEAHADFLALLAAPLLLVLIDVFSPVLWLVDSVIKRLHFRSPGTKNRVDEDEIKMMALMGISSGDIEKEEARLIHQVFQLNDITVDDMMTQLVEVESIPGDVKLGNMHEWLLQVRHSRLPVIGNTPENILGVVLLRDLLAAIAEDKFEMTALDFVKAPIFVNSDLSAAKLLPIFQKKEQHLAIVVDDSRQMIGVVSLEDVIEELVGEITDETDVRSETIRRVSSDEILVDEATDVSKINHFFNIAIAYDGTIGDYVEDKFQRCPKVGEEIKDGSLTYRVAAMSRTRPKAVSIKKQS